ncbi:hypothetical protein [Agromyces sp. ZXT2-6]|uniref:hypothetical protein n=1 Tax=Agromyces sp. ZXT2-6 TaxID=3461153 RepID=UPI004054A83A
MDRIILTALLVGGYLALAVAANVGAPAPAPAPAQAEAAAAIAAVPPSADAAERWYASVRSVGAEAQTADAAERALTSSFVVLPKPFASR